MPKGQAKRRPFPPKPLNRSKRECKNKRRCFT